MPGTDVERDNQHGVRITQRIASSAETVIFSFAHNSLDGSQQPSPALEDLSLIEVGIDDLAGPESQANLVELETVEDTAPIQALPDRVAHGGSRILELQAACGFRAFAEHRLRSTAIEPDVLGMDARERGQVVHRVLELFWKETKTQSALKLMSLAERSAPLDQCISQALKKTADLCETAWDNAYLTLQQERLRRLLNAWLDSELERPQFEVELSEKKLEGAQIGPLRFNIRVDRVDRTEPGELIIDYKTGSASPSDWSGERPDKPQLPLYAVLSNSEHLAGVAFGLVRAGEKMELKGYAAAPHVLLKPTPMKKPSLEAHVEEWKSVLVRLATEFHNGEARVEPKKYPKTCKYCAQRILCRLDTTLLADEDDDATTEAAGG
jgi:probable DNA repair protein